MREARAGGPAGVLGLAYGFFTLAAGARSAVQIGSTLPHPPLAYLTSGVAALVYAASAVAVPRTGDRVLRTLFVVELIGVLVVGTASVVRSAWFVDATVWGWFGAGYGFVPLVLPLLGLWWLRVTASDAGEDRRQGQQHHQ